MIYRAFGVAVLSIGVATSLSAQVSQAAKFEILRTVVAQQAAARVAMPPGGDVELTDSGDVNKDKVTKQLDKEGVAIEPGKVVTITQIDFGGKDVSVELDGGGKKKKG